MDGAPPGGGGLSQSLVDSSPRPPHMRSSTFDGRKYHLRVKRPGDNPTALPNNPFWFATLIEGKLKRSLKKEVEMAIESKGMSYTLTTRNPKLADELKGITELDTNTKIEIIDHPGLNRTLGMVYQPESADETEENLQKALESQGVTNVRKITKFVDGKQVPTPLMVLTFGSTKLPKEVFFGWMRVEVRTYYESPMICRNCLEYRHTKKRCQNATRCTRCSGPHSNANNTCKNDFKCPHCPEGNNDHSAAGRKCPQYRHEEAVIRVKTDESISWAEARKKVGTPKATSYASVAGADSGQANTQDQQIANLSELVKQLTAEIKDLKKYKENFENLQTEYNTFKNKVKFRIVELQERARSLSPAKPTTSTTNTIQPLGPPPAPQTLNLTQRTPANTTATKRGAQSPLTDPTTKRSWATEEVEITDEDIPLISPSPSPSPSPTPSPAQSPTRAGKKQTAALKKGQHSKQPFRPK